ncbi:MAG TPA: HEAT repeat domain-containing protein [Gemmatimonadaceae bacterium]|nr:HEAT repeat domain-containing protein [Gemmatimonadaceae bacterium]
MPFLRRILGPPNVQKHLEKRDVAKLIADLRDEDTTIRATAATALGKLGDSKGAPALIAAFDDEEHEVTDAVASALGNMSPDIIPLLAPVIAIGQTWTRGDKAARSAIKTIAHRDFQNAVPALRELLGHSEWRVRLAAKEAMVPQGAAALPIAVEALTDPRREARVVAAGILGALEMSEGVQPLIGALRDEHAEVRQAAAEALGNIRDSRAVDGLITLVEDSTDPPRTAAILALGKLRATQAVTSLIKVMEGTSDDRLLGNLADALRNIADPSAANALRSALDRAGTLETREELFSAIAVLHDPSSREMILEEVIAEERRLQRRSQLNAQEFKLVISLVGSLALVGGEDVVAALVERLESPLSFDIVDGNESERFYPIRDAARTALTLMGRNPEIDGSDDESINTTQSSRFEIKS